MQRRRRDFARRIRERNEGKGGRGGMRRKALPDLIFPLNQTRSCFAPPLARGSARLIRQIAREQFVRRDSRANCAGEAHKCHRKMRHCLAKTLPKFRELFARRRRLDSAWDQESERDDLRFAKHSKLFGIRSSSFLLHPRATSRAKTGGLRAKCG